jgi:hypothetical protein
MNASSPCTGQFAPNSGCVPVRVEFGLTQYRGTGIAHRRISVTLRNFELTGRCNLETFVRILEVLGATQDLASVLLKLARYLGRRRARHAI